MTPAIFILVIVLISKGIIFLLPASLIVFKIIGWPLLIYLIFSIAIDLLSNIPRTLKSGPHEHIQKTVNEFKKRYMLVIGTSLLIRILTVFLIFSWFLDIKILF